eukprot:CAMPEP_0172472610 /NCGR_PEP_ID=MMETSP1065-20121228/68422_1 /TAXON_ID=265537 /ORGANISM="Amphiprora paludosa, Strain CCMP125" /LENGTH=1280 /DNA_ID=CAMNT_0013230757 /DNA_START=216 /DNA_END=4058 /DNA_ORIENTATION=+
MARQSRSGGTGDRVDRGDDRPPSAAPSSKGNKGSANGKPPAAAGSNGAPPSRFMDAVAQQAAQAAKNKVSDSDLKQLEKRLNEEVDEDFFEEPRRFNTLPRVIDVLGVQMIDDATVQESSKSLVQNPSYKQLKAQHQVVEDAIEHMAVIHCADLNASVISVGRVARQFSDAVEKVRNLRKQVRDIQDSLGPTNQGMDNSKSAAAPSAAGAAAMSLRELWLKKLECEATLSLLDKLDVIRAAPARFDELMKKARIGAAVLTVSQALDTMFRDDVAQVQALHKIMEQLMIRKQTAEEVVWDTLTDVIFLRTGNGLPSSDKLHGNKLKKKQDDPSTALTSGAASSSQSIGSDSRRSGATGSLLGGPGAANKLPKKGGATKVSSSSKFVISNGVLNPFMTRHFKFATDEEEEYLLHIAAAGGDVHDGDSVASDTSNASLFSIEGDVGAEAAAAAAANVSDDASVGSSRSKESGPAAAAASKGHARRLTIPIPMIEAELDLEQDERRIQEELSLAGMATQSTRSKAMTASTSSHRFALPCYADPVLALRILVECMAQLKRLDDVERILLEQVQQEIRLLVQREQARTFARMEKRTTQSSIRFSGKSNHLKDFRRHLTGLLSSFGCVLTRLSHLAQILRFRISSDRELMQKIESPNSVMRSVITTAHELMQQEITAFLKACLKEEERPSGVSDTTMDATAVHKTTEGSLFSLGIIEETKGGDDQANKLATATRSNVVEMPTARFTSSVLFSKTKNTPQTRHALTFRRMVARWTSETDYMKYELAKLTGEDTSAPSFSVRGSETAIAYLDKVIQKDLLPAMQEEAVNGTVLGLERRDGFDPVLDRAVFNQTNSNEPQDVDMCVACQSVYSSTGPLFMALHRLPRGGEMYLPVVAVLEHVMLTFLSRIKTQIEKLCENKTALKLLEEDGGKPSALAMVMERRKPFTRLVNAYADGDMLEAATATANTNKQQPLLAPPAGDTPSQVEEKTESFNEEVADGVEGEEMIMEQELKTLMPLFEFSKDKKVAEIKVCTDEELMKALTLAHSLLKVASLLESRLKIRNSSGFNKPLTSTRPLRESIKTVMQSGLKIAKFCRLDMLFQNVVRLAKVCKSSTLVARDAVRIPSSVNDLGEYLTGASDNLREAAGNAVTAYTLSSLEQYIPFCLMQTVRVVAEGKGIIHKAPLTMNGIEALDRSGSVLYRDLKGSTAFDNSFWDVELAALSFERSASFMAMMELEMEELVAYYNANQTDFPEEDFILMFSMTGPRRQGDVGRFHMIKRREKKSKKKS